MNCDDQVPTFVIVLVVGPIGILLWAAVLWTLRLLWLNVHEDDY